MRAPLWARRARGEENFSDLYGITQASTPRTARLWLRAVRGPSLLLPRYTHGSTHSDTGHGSRSRGGARELEVLVDGPRSGCGWTLCVHALCSALTSRLCVRKCIYVRASKPNMWSVDIMSKRSPQSRSQVPGHLKSDNRYSPAPEAPSPRGTHARPPVP